MVKKKAKTPVVTSTVITPVTAADLVSAGIVDFKLTKEDLIDLLVEEAVRSAQEEVERFQAAARSLENAKFSAENTWSAALDVAARNHPVILAALRVFPRITRADLRYPHYVLDAVDAASSGSCYIRLDKVLLADAPGVKEAQARLDAAVTAEHANGVALLAAEETLSRIKASPRKIRVALVRQVLATSDKGKFALDNVAKLSQDVLAAVRLSVQAEHAADTALLR